MTPDRRISAVFTGFPPSGDTERFIPGPGGRPAVEAKAFGQPRLRGVPLSTVGGTVGGSTTKEV